MTSLGAVLEPDRTKGTGAEVRDLPDLAAGAVRPSDLSAAVDADFLERGKRHANQIGKDTAQRSALLGIVLAALPGVDFEDTCRLVRASTPSKLLRWMHGDEQIPQRPAQQLESVAKMLANLHRVLKPEATSQWLHTAIPALGGRTPLDFATRGKVDDLVELTQAYLDPSFK